MYKVLQSAIFFLIVPALFGDFEGMEFLLSPDRCEVLDVVRIHSPREITFRVKSWKGIENLRLRAELSGLEKTEDAAVCDEAIRWMQGEFQKARTINLRNLRPRNYFRVFADIEIDGNDLAWELIKRKFVRSKERAESPVFNGEERSPEYRDSIMSPDISRRQAVKKNPFFYDSVSLEHILDTEIDLSGFDADTPFREIIEEIQRSFDPPLPLIVLWADLEKHLFVRQDTPIGIGGLDRMSVKLALELILSSVGNQGGIGKPVVLQEDTIFLVVSEQFSAARLKTKIYRVEELMNPPIAADESGRGDVSSGSRGNDG